MRFASTALAVALALALPLSSARADDVKLVTGETLKGRIVSRDADGGVVLDHPVLGRLTIPATKLAPPPAPPSPWKFRAELGASGSSGNSDQSDLHAAITALHESDSGRLKAGAGWAMSQTDGEKTKDQKYLEGTYDVLFPDSPWSVFVTGRIEWDDFQDWDRRGTFGLGAGYALADRKDLKARVRGGLATTREWGSSDPDRDSWRLEGLVGAEAAWKLDRRHSIEAKTTWYPDLQTSGEYRLVSSASWAVRLADDSALSLKLGLEHEYDTHNPAPYEKSDFRWFAALLVEF